MDPEPRWRERPRPPARRVLAHSEPCPRKALAAAVARGRDGYAALSRMLNRPDRYLDRFVREGHPAALTAIEHQALADYFGLEPRELGVRELWLPMEQAA